jgi:hypothetical protein
MKKLILILSFLALVSCGSMKGKQADRVMYDEADPTEEIKLSAKSQREMMAREKAEEGFNLKRFFQTLMSNETPNRLVPEFPELLRKNDISDQTVFRSF